MTLPTTPMLHLFAATAAALLMALVPAVASAHDYHCRYHRGVLAGNEVGLVWHSGHSLYGCSVEYDEGVYTRRLGPWAPGTMVKTDGANVVWTVPTTSGGISVDRMWGANIHDGSRWLTGTKPVPQGPGHPFLDARIYKLFQTGEQAAWITVGGDVVAATGGPGAEISAVGLPPSPLVWTKQLVLVGHFPTIDPHTLAAHAHLTEGDGETDDCGGSNPYTFTLETSASGPVFGATWFADFTDVPIKECS
jgi:hypothetical protein